MTALLCDQINGWADGWAAAMTRAIWQGTAGLGIVWLTCRAVPRLPARARCWLWWLVLLKLLVALVWAGPIRLPWLPPANAPSPAAARLESRPGLGLPHAAETAAAIPMARLSTPASLLLLWLAGVGGGLAWVAREGWSTRVLRRSFVPVGQASLKDGMEGFCRQFGLRRPPPLMASSEVDSPLLLGLFQPVVVLPAKCLQEPWPGRLRLMVAHELAHLQRGDLWWGWGPALARVLFFFHPLVWLGQREFRLAQEMACDELAVRISQAAPLEYGAMLVRAAAEGGASPGLAAVGVVESYQTVQRRLRALKRAQPLSRRQAVAIAGLALGPALLAIVPWQLVAAVDQPLGGSPPERAPAGTSTPQPVRSFRSSSEEDSAPRPAAAARLGTSRITVRARARDGTRPLGSRCEIERASPQQSPFEIGVPTPVVSGTNGDWTIANVVPGPWSIRIVADDFAWHRETNLKELHLTNAQDLTVSFTLLRGSTLRGRVVEAATGRPLQGGLVATAGRPLLNALVSFGDWDACEATTDADGRFAVNHLFPGTSLRVRVRKAGYVPRWSQPVEADEGAIVTAPEIQMSLGGWIVGRVLPPRGTPEGTIVGGSVIPTSEGPPSPELALESAGLDRSESTFRLGPLPSGHYTLEASLGTGKAWAGHPLRRWAGKVTHIRVETGVETKDIVIPVQESTGQ